MPRPACRAGTDETAVSTLFNPDAPLWTIGVRSLITYAVIVGGCVVHQRAVRREGLTPEDLEAAVRNHGLASMDEVKRAVLEIDGSISVIPANQPSIRTQPDLLRSR